MLNEEQDENIINLNFDITPLLNFFKKRYAQLFFLSLIIYLITENHILGSGPDGLTLALQYELIAHHSFNMAYGGHLIYSDVTDMTWFVNGYYGKQSYGLAFILLPFYAIGYAIDNGIYSPFGYQDLFDRIGIAIISSILVAEMYRINKNLYNNEKIAAISALALGFGTTIFPFSEVIFYHTFSALALLEFTYYSYIYLKGKGSALKLMASSFFAGIGAFVDNSVAVAVLTVAILLLVFSILLNKSEKKAVVESFLLAVAVPLIIQIWLNQLVFGDPLFFAGLEGSLFSLKNALTHFAYYIISPYRGILFFDPILILLLYYAFRYYAKRPILGSLTILPFLTTILFVSSYYYWDGGLSFGPRFLVPEMPLLFMWFPAIRNRKVLFTFAGISYAINMLASLMALVPVSPTNYFGFGNPFSFYQFYHNALFLINGKAPLWISLGNGIYPSLALTYFVIVFDTCFLVLYSYYTLVR